MSASVPIYVLPACSLTSGPGPYMLQKSKSTIFDGCNPLKYRDTILDKSVKNQFLQQEGVSQVLIPHLRLLVQIRSG
jgi:hypothetical protein